MRQVNFAHKRSPSRFRKTPAPRSVECPGAPDGTSGSFLYLGVGDGCGSSLPLVAEASAAAGLRGRTRWRAWRHWPPTMPESKFLFWPETRPIIVISSAIPRQRAEFVDGVFGELARLHLPMLRLANLPADSATSRTLKGSRGQAWIPGIFPAGLPVRADHAGSADERQELKAGGAQDGKHFALTSRAWRKRAGHSGPSDRSGMLSSRICRASLKLMWRAFAPVAGPAIWPARNGRTFLPSWPNCFPARAGWP